jgi:hypothetical protein
MTSDIETTTDILALRYLIGKRAPVTAFSRESRNAAIGDMAELAANLRGAGWTVRQVVHHVADAHLVLYVRVKLALTDDNPAVTLWDEVSWAELPDARSMAIDGSLAIVHSVHARFVHQLRMLTPDQFSRTLRHPMWGVIPVDELIEICAWHGKHHVAHIRGLRKRSGW